MKKFDARHNSYHALLVAIVFLIAITSLGISLSLLPVYISQIQLLSNYCVGAVISSESLITLLSRPYAGRYSDTHGPKPTMFLGLSLMGASGALTLSAFFTNTVSTILAFLLLVLSRIPMGIGESMVFTSCGTWPIGLVGRQHAGKLMSWIGVALFLGLALGNYLGIWSYQHVHLLIGMSAMTLLPVIGIAITCSIKKIIVDAKPARLPLGYTIKRVWKAGAGFALGSVGYSAIMAFLALLFLRNGWHKEAAIAPTTFSIGYIATRLVLSSKSDELGLKTVILSLLGESIGLLILITAPHPLWGLVGSFLTGLGLSMVYPLLALQAIRSLPKQNLGLAISTYDACFDISVLIAGTIGGGLASYLNYKAVFTLALFCALAAILCAYWAYRQPSADDTP